MKNVLHRLLAFMTALLIAFSSVTLNGSVFVYAAEGSESVRNEASPSEEEVQSNEEGAEELESDEELEEVSPEKENKDDGLSDEQQIDPKASQDVDVSCTVGTDSNVVVDNGNAYFSSFTLVIVASPDGDADEVESIELLSSDGTSVNKITKDDDEITNVAVMFPIQKSFKGLQIVIKTKDLPNGVTKKVNDYVQELSDDTNYIYAPEGIKITTNEELTTVKVKEVDGVNYVTKEGILVEDITSDAPIDNEDISVKIEADGEEVPPTYVIKQTDTGYQFSVDLSEVDGDVLKVSLTVVDLLGRGVAQDATLEMQRSNYSVEISDISSDTREVEDDITYSDGDIKITFSATGSIKSIDVMSDGTSVKSLGTTGGSFTVKNTGYYTLRVVDVIDNETEYPFNLIEGAEDLTSSIVIDRENPVITIDKVPDLGSNWYNSIPQVTVSVEDENLASVDISLDGVNVYTGSSSQINVDLSGLQDGSHTITVVATDKVGNSSQESTKINYDSSIGGLSASVNKKYNVVDGVAYFKENPNVIITDPEQGVTYTLDGVAVRNTFALSREGDHILSATDKAGNVTTAKLDDLLGFNTSTYVVDGKTPVITEEFEKALQSNSKKWYGTKTPVLKYKVVEDNIKSITAYLNGQSYSLQADDEGKVTVPTEGIVENKNTLYLVVEDKSGNVPSGKTENRTSTYEFWVDTIPAVLGETVINPSGTGKEYEDGSHFASAPTITVSGIDDGVGIKEYRVNGQKITTTNSGKGEKKNLTTGEYTVSVVDKFDRETSKPLGETFGENSWQTNMLIVDSNKPILVRSNSDKFENGDYKSGGNVWFGSKPELNYILTDNNPLSIVVKVNNSLPYFVAIPAGSKSIPFTVETSNMKEGSNTVLITALDRAGNFVTDTYTFMLDETSPVLVASNIGGNQYTEATYFKSYPRVDLSSSTDKQSDKRSNGSGIAAYYLDTLDNKVTNGIFILPEGTHSLKVEDNVGHQSDWITVGASQGWKVCTTNKIVVDTEAPVISRQGDVFKGEYKDSKGLWFGSKPDLGYSVSDANLDLSQITIKTGTGKASSGTATPNASKSDMYEGSNSVIVSATDKAGNNSSDTYTFMLDLTKPTVKASDMGGVKYANDGTYFQSNPTVDFSSSTDGSGSGIKEYNLNGVSNTNGKFTITSTGTYTVVVTDNVGHQSDAVTVGSLMGWSGTNKVVIDRSNPTITRVSGFNPTQINGVNWYSSSPALVYEVKDDNLLSITYKLNNGNSVKINASSDGKVYIPAGIFAEYAANNISLTAQDKSLRSVTDSIFSFKWDGTAPTFTGATLISGEKPKTYGANDNVYFKANPTIRLSATDAGNSGVGIKSFAVDGNSSNTGEFTLGGGSHSATVSDLLNNTSRASSVVGLLGWNALNNFIIDNTAPTLQILGINPALRDGDGKEWYASKPSLQVKVNDSHLRDVVATVTRADGTSTTVIKETTNGTFGISLETVGDGKVVIDVQAVDKAENSSRAGYTFYLDRTAPTGLDGTVNQSFLERDTGTFFKKTPTLTLTARDAGVGVNKYYLDGNGSTTGSFVLSDGRHTVYVDDRLGNKTNAVAVNKDGLKSVGFSNSRVVTDGVNPVISCKRPDGDVNSWYAKDQTFNATITDNVAIQKATMKINGVVIASFTSHGSDEKTVNLSASTARATAKSDGSYDVLIEVEDKAGNVANWTDTIKIDRTAPKITRFVFQGTSINGSEINGGDRYGFFSTGTPTVKIYADDGQVTSGLNYAVVTINGNTRNVSFVAGVATVSLPANTKGFISAYAVDRVLNKGTTERPDGYVSESSNTHVNSVSVELNLPSTTYKDAQGLPLYNKSLAISVSAGCSLSGIASMRWGVGDKTSGRATVDLNGNISGDVGVKTTEKNLVLTMKNTLQVPNNENGLEVWVQITDRLGHVSEDRKKISIDTDSPVVKLTYDDGPTTKSFYSKERKAVLSITERNFNKEAVKIAGVFGKMGTWRRVGNTWSADVTFGEEKDYEFTIDVTDLAGNKNDTLKDKFTVDAQAPRIEIKFDNNSVKNKKYYKKARKATITVTDVNFDKSKVELKGTKEKLGEWKQDDKDSKVWTNELSFTKDGIYSFTLKCTDKAGNVSEEAKVDEFVIDTKKPEIIITGVSNGLSYKESMPLSVSVSDTNLDKKNTKVSLTGKKNGEMKLDTKVKGTSGEYSLDGFDKDKKYDDIYSLDVNIIDKAGNVSKETVLFSLNRYGSEFSDENNIFGNYLNEARDVDIAEQNLEKIDTSKCTITILKDGKTLDVSDNDYEIKEKEEEFGWKYIYHIKKEVFKEDGTYQIQIYSVLYDGTDYSSASKEYAFVLDTTPPEILITGVENSKTYKDYSRTVTVDIRDLSGLQDMVIAVNGDKIEVAESEDNSYTFDLTESSSMQNISVSATDMAGNETVEAVNAVMITSSTLLYTVNQTWFRWLVGSVGGLSGALVGLLLYRRVKTRKKEKELAKTQISEIERSRSSSGSGSSGVK